MAVKIKKGNEMMQIPVVPLVDTLFNLLIFFLLATKIVDAERALDVDLPEASEAQAMTAPTLEMVINVDKDGQYFLSAKKVSLAEIDKELARLRKNDPLKASVQIRADKGCQWQSVVALVNSCVKARIRKYTTTTRDTTRTG
jgi:biopolymer transport protein ExbD